MTIPGGAHGAGYTERRRGSRWFLGCLLALMLAFLLLLLVSMLVFGGGFGSAFATGPHIGILQVQGEIHDAAELVRELDELETDRRVRAVVVRVDSPGGAVGATQEVHKKLQELGAAGLPVVASLGNVAASGGYYVAVACDSILANPGTLTGSIGAIFSFPETGELFRKIGVRWEVVRSGEFKDVGSMSRPMTARERELLSGIVADVLDQFVAAVAAGRRMSQDDVRAVADGRLLTGRQAFDVGLVDRLGTLEDARILAAGLAGVSETTPFLSKHRERFSLREFLRSGVAGLVGRWSARDRGPRLEYRLE